MPLIEYLYFHFNKQITDVELPVAEVHGIQTEVVVHQDIITMTKHGIDLQNKKVKTPLIMISSSIWNLLK